MPFPSLKPARRPDTRSPLLLLLPFLFPTILLFVPLPSLRPLPSTTHRPPPLAPPLAHPIPPNYTTPTHCVLYDRPPHTASTTISQALTKCLKTHHYATTTPPFDAVPADHTISDLVFNHSVPHRAATNNHLSISPSDVYLLRLVCSPNFFYITSTRTMPERITSSAKYVLTPTHQSSVLSVEQMEQAMRIASGDHVNEERFERYPFDDVEGPKLTPDYVIRYEELEADLGSLLEAMGCAQGFETLNVHGVVGEGESGSMQERTRQALRLRFADARHREMLRLAREGNDSGLRKAREFFGEA